MGHACGEPNEIGLTIRMLTACFNTTFQAKQDEEFFDKLWSQAEQEVIHVQSRVIRNDSWARERSIRFRLALRTS